MSNFVISTDKCCDETVEFLKENGVEYIPFPYIVNEEVFYDSFSDEKDYVSFYSLIDAGNKISTSGLNYGETEEFFLNLLQKHKKDIVHICLSSGLSGTYNTLCSVAEEINKTSQNKVFVIDSLSATVGQGLLLRKAILLRDNFETVEKSVEDLKKFAKKISASFYVSDLDCLKRGGRISGAAAVVAKLIQIKPYLEIDGKGQLKVLQKIIGAGSKKAISVMVNRFVENYDKTENLPVIIVKTTDNQSAIDLQNELKKVTNAEIITKFMGPVISSHTGKGTLGLVYALKNNKQI